MLQQMIVFYAERSSKFTRECLVKIKWFRNKQFPVFFPAIKIDRILFQWPPAIMSDYTNSEYFGMDLFLYKIVLVL